MSGNSDALATCGLVFCCPYNPLPIHSASAVIPGKGFQIELEILPTDPCLLQPHYLFLL